MNIRHALLTYLASGGAVAAPFDPLTLSPLIWLKSNAGLYQDSGKTTPATADTHPIGAWADQSGNGNDLVQTVNTIRRPLLKLNRLNSYSGILFDGSDDFLKKAFTWNQPEHIFMVFKQVTWTGNRNVFDGVTGDSMWFCQTTASPQIKTYAGSFGPVASAIPLDTFVVLEVLYNGAGSRIRVNGANQTTGNVGASNAGGITLGTHGSLSGSSNIEVVEFFGFSSIVSDPGITSLASYFSSKYALP